LDDGVYPRKQSADMSTMKTLMFLSVVRYLFTMPYRRLDGFTQAYTKTTHRLGEVFLGLT